MEIVAGALLLATFVEGLINYLFGVNEGEYKRHWIRYIALVAGIALAIAYQLDILSLTGLVAIHPMIGYIVSGLIIGRGSNYLNDFVSSFKK